MTLVLQSVCRSGSGCAQLTVDSQELLSHFTFQCIFQLIQHIESASSLSETVPSDWLFSVSMALEKNYYFVHLKTDF